MLLFLAKYFFLAIHVFSYHLAALFKLQKIVTHQFIAMFSGTLPAHIFASKAFQTKKNCQKKTFPRLSRSVYWVRRIQFYSHFIFWQRTENYKKHRSRETNTCYIFRGNWPTASSLLFLCNPKIETAIIPFFQECAYVHLEDLINNNERRTKENIYFFRYCCNVCSSIRPKSIRNLSDIIRSFVFLFFSFHSHHSLLLLRTFVHAVPLHHFQLSPNEKLTSTLAQRDTQARNACCTMSASRTHMTPVCVKWMQQWPNNNSILLFSTGPK